MKEEKDQEEKKNSILSEHKTSKSMLQKVKNFFHSNNQSKNASKNLNSKENNPHLLNPEDSRFSAAPERKRDKLLKLVGIRK
ncbi:hypothetical protein [Holospora curviuscula]|nr:hypothetical protein [Holospora curviuscula]